MKRLVLALLFMAGISIAADTTTTRAGLVKPDEDSTGWGPKVRVNYDIIDSSFALLSGTQTYTATQTFGSSVTFSSATFAQIKISTPGYSASNDALIVNGVIKNFSSGGGSIQACDQNAQNCSLYSNGSLIFAVSGANSVQIMHDQTVQGGVQFRSGTQGSFATTTSNLPNVFSADRLMVGPTYGDRIGNSIEASGDRSAFQESVYIGTHTVSGTPRFAVVGDTTTVYSVLIGTSATTSSTNYQVGVSTSGAFGLSSLTAATIRATKPNRHGELFACSDCSSIPVCISTGTAVAQWSVITAKGTICN